MGSPYRTSAREIAKEIAIPTVPAWVAVLACACALMGVPTVFALGAIALAAVARPIPETRMRAAGIATIALALASALLPHVALLGVARWCAVGWIALEMRRPIERSPGLVLVAAAPAMTWPGAGPIAFGILFFGTMLPLTQMAAPTSATWPWRRELEPFAGAFLVIAAVMFNAFRLQAHGCEAILIACALFAIALLRTRPFPLPVYIAVHGAVVAQVIALYAKQEAISQFSELCGIALEALAIVGFGMFLPKNSVPRFAVLVAGLMLGCGAFAALLPEPGWIYALIAFVPSVGFIAIALKQACTLKPITDEADPAD